MEYYIDTHAHLYLDQFDDDREQVIDDAVQNDVKKILLPNIDKASIGPMLQMEENYPGTCHPMMGLHPCSVSSDFEEQLELVKDWFSKRDFIAVGEIGTDLYWDKTYKNEQEHCFRAQLRLAAEYNRPAVIHSRESLDWSINIVAEELNANLKGVFHCFTGTIEQAWQIMELGFMMGIGGVLTFKNSGLDAVAREIPMSHMVLETDSPYLTPAPYRGKRNSSAYIPLIAAKLAEIKEVSVESVMAATTENALRLFPGIS